MPLRPTLELINAARAQGAGIGAFNVLHLESAEALVAGAESAGLPVILQISENCVKYHGGRLAPIALATLEVAREAGVDVAVHLDHAEDEALARAGVAAGFGSVMYDGSRLPHADNLAATARVVDLAHDHGVAVEAELGEVGGKDGAHAPGVRTDPHEAAAFVAATGVDGLAVAVGSEHAMTTATAHLDLDLIARLAAAVPVPLVLHGSSGVPPGTLQDAVRAAIRKINIGTALNVALTAQVRRALAADDAPRASMIAAPRLPTLGRYSFSYHAMSSTASTAFWPLTVALNRSGNIVGEWLPQMVRSWMSVTATFSLLASWATARF